MDLVLSNNAKDTTIPSTSEDEDTTPVHDYIINKDLLKITVLYAMANSYCSCVCADLLDS